MFSRIIRSNNALIQRASFSTQSALLRNAQPKPSAEIPTPEAFLNKIGRNTIEHLEHFPSWHALFNTTSRQMKEKGIDVQSRRYIINMLEKYRCGEPIKEFKKGKKSYFGGEYKRKEVTAKIWAEQRKQRYELLEAEDKANRGE
ncbi:hypothetical protein BN7_3504 [Wickerhamomyces ciferrii]|uniref:Small ribosomal subunit protein mS41 n=1 Tax=Wickerhamomyces ciferrii (strain ATCC 14091 / BCRC 22168 / CBS 111 / JCM 3599 / NBRC 0793 / NRRL Y-1031 F-60-10) TaxID=1206466 RepID=K0KRL7_WICCF|nr:uncharacterized protein BN7_3504 [Wickerhamomyces ciferrii]CCH43949.1 hypothetical protein BN7_3504 [Wickerhamomyces ciferrii]